jgi:cobalt/nickel transport system permease protein
MHIELDKYAHLDSMIHNWDIRFKIVSLIILIFAFSFIKEIVLIPFILILSITLVFLSQIPFFYVIKRLKYILLFLIIMVLVLSISSGGTVLYSFYIFSVYKEGFWLGFIIFFRTVTILMVFFIVLESAPFHRTIIALYSLKIPEKLISIIYFTYRYIYVYFEAYRKMKIALQIRGMNNRLIFFHFKTQSGIIGSMLIRSFEQAERIYSAMILRGYRGKFMINSKFSSCRQDYIKTFIILFIITILLGIQFSL